jgi:hypothetical protein
VFQSFQAPSVLLCQNAHHFDALVRSDLVIPHIKAFLSKVGPCSARSVAYWHFSDMTILPLDVCFEG